MTIRIWAIVVGAIVAVSGSGTAVASEAESSETGTPPGGFSDVGSVHRYGIEQVAKLGIDAGCGEGRFCPDDPISRAEMAAWLYRATASRVIAAPGGAFNPDGLVTRAEAAVMLTAAFEHLSPADEIQGVFADTSYTPAAGAIESIHAAGLTKGCAANPLRYCPHQPITRGQAAAMLARAIQRAEPTVGLIVNEPQAARGYTLLNSRNAKIIYLIDELGRYVHKWELEGYTRFAKLLDNGNLLTDYRHGINQGRFVAELDLSGNIIWEYSAGITHHDFLKLPNGNILLLMRGQLTTQEAIALGADPRYLTPEGLRYDYLREVKPTGPTSSEIVWEWSMLDHLIQDRDTHKSNYGTIAGNPGRIDINYFFRRSSDIESDPPRDIALINAIDYNPILDQIMLSSRQLSELWIIDHNTTTKEAAGEKGDLLYRWGNPRTHGAGGYEDQQLFGPHNTQWIPQGLPGAGNVLIFNNGTEFTVQPRYYSTIDEIILPSFQGRTYLREEGSGFAPPDRSWTYTAQPPADFYASQGSGTQRLPNGNTQICDSTSGTIFQVTPGGETVWKYINPTVRGIPTIQGHNLQIPTYRAPWYPPDYPGLKDLDLMPKGPIEHYR